MQGSLAYTLKYTNGLFISAQICTDKTAAGVIQCTDVQQYESGTYAYQVRGYFSRVIPYNP